MSAPAYMQTGSSCAAEYSSIQSMRKDKGPRGAVSSSTAPAPSDSIQRRNSFSNAISGCSSSACSLCSFSASKWRASKNGENSSEPLATARCASPARNASQAYFSAAVPARQTPAHDTTSRRGQPSSPCTITAWLGINWSGSEVPLARQSTLPMSPRSRMAAAVSCALLIAGSPVARSMA